ncbi:MAG: hypothetical protein DWC07_02145 [Candidatus Poseidoniales archaeon]|nr:MAG: hypothetical protein DWC07_02145 [Candidatus Poseidoniales archaeon]
MQPPLPPSASTSPYQPSTAAMKKGHLYSFSLWLTLGLTVLVVSAVFSEFPLDSSVPVASDYDLTEEGAADQFADDLKGHATQVDLFSAISGILQTSSLAFLAYAFAREAHEESSLHVALRITMVLGAVILVTSVVGRNFSLL